MPVLDMDIAYYRVSKLILNLQRKLSRLNYSPVITIFLCFSSKDVYLQYFFLVIHYFLCLQDVVTENEFEKRLLADVIPPDDIGVTFDDIGALENVKDTLKELVMLPLQRPELFCKGQLTKVYENEKAIFFHEKLYTKIKGNNVRTSFSNIPSEIDVVLIFYIIWLY